MTQHQLKHIPIEELKVSPLNMRHSRKAPQIDDIYPSILKSGVHESMLVRREGKKWGVVAGRRRLFALRRKARETGKAQRAPCAIMKPGDDAAAMEASLIENTGHQPVTEMEAYDAYGRLAKDGRNVDDIAEYFGVTPLKVKRILALSNLHDDIRALYAAEELDVASIRALTLATPEQQVEWLKLWTAEDARAPTGKRLKDWISGGAAITADKALFDLETYPGRVLDDLFGEHGQFEDADLFWEHQSAAIAERVDAYRARGWTDVVVLERGAFFSTWEYVKRTKKQGGKVFVSLRYTGEVEFHEGYITNTEHRRSEAAKTAKGKPETVKPEMSGPMATHIALHRHSAARAALLDHPKIALRFTVAHMMAGSALWDVRPHQARSAKPATLESVIAAPPSTKLGDEETAISELFESKGAVFTLRQNGDAYRLCEVFAALLKMSEAEVLRVLTFVMAETLEAGGAAVEAVLHVTGCESDKQIPLDDVFWELLRDKRPINAMVAEIADEATAKAALTDTAKNQKQIIRNRIDGKGCEATPDWRPGWMMTPPTSYVTGAASPSKDAWTRVAALFETSETSLDYESGDAENPAR
jgi:ParB family chromosome partitioning protein